MALNTQAEQRRSTVAALAEAALAIAGPVSGAAPFLRHRPASLAVSRDAEPVDLPVTRWLADAPRCAAPATAALVSALARSAGALAWRQSYQVADFGPAFLDRYGWTELVGPRGPIACDGLACGVLLLGPDIVYPGHAHAAEELYLPLAGTALWQRGEDPPVAVPPGMPVHHPSWLSHAMRTEAEPLVALYLWRGAELDAKPRITSPAS